MTPAARYAAAIEVLDMQSAGVPAEKCLTNWARAHRFAGSKDRAAIRDHVFDVLRAKRSLAALGGGETGRQLVLGLLRREGIAIDTVFSGEGYAPAPLSVAELHNQTLSDTLPQSVASDIPDWLWPVWQDNLGKDAKPAADVLKSRAPVFLRVNRKRIDRDGAQAKLAEDGIVTKPHDMVATALEVIENERKVKLSQAFLTGLVDLQDAASQIAVASLPLTRGARVLDYCAGGGGKALALADMFDADVTAHDIAIKRMADIPNRAARADVAISTVSEGELNNQPLFDAVFCDAPCSGSGTWRRTPESKWALSPDKLIEYNALQGKVLVKSAQYVAPDGLLAYATCSVLTSENDDIVSAFLDQKPGWEQVSRLKLVPNADHDGFFMVVLRKLKSPLT